MLSIPHLGVMLELGATMVNLANPQQYGGRDDVVCMGAREVAVLNTAIQTLLSMVSLHEKPNYNELKFANQ